MNFFQLALTKRWTRQRQHGVQTEEEDIAEEACSRAEQFGDDAVEGHWCMGPITGANARGGFEGYDIGLQTRYRDGVV